MAGEGNEEAMTGAAPSETTYDGEAVVVCVDMWDSVARKGGLGKDGTGVGVGPVLAHKTAVIEQLREEIDAAGVAAWLVKDLGDGVMVVFPTSDGPPSAPGGLREREVASEVALQFAVKAVRAAAGEGPLQPNAIAVSFGPVHLSVDGTYSGAPSLLGYTAVLGVRGYPVDVASRLVAVAAENQVLLCTHLREQLVSPTVDVGEGLPVVVDDTAREVRLPASSDPMRWARVTAYQLVQMDDDLPCGLVGDDEPAPITNRHARLAEQAALAAALGTLQDGWSSASRTLGGLAGTSKDTRPELVVREWEAMATLAAKTRAAVATAQAGEELAGSDIALNMLDVSETVDAVDRWIPGSKAWNIKARDVTDDALKDMAEVTDKLGALLHDIRNACQEAIAKGETRIAPKEFGGSSR